MPFVHSSCTVTRLLLGTARCEIHLPSLKVCTMKFVSLQGFTDPSQFVRTRNSLIPILSLPFPSTPVKAGCRFSSPSGYLFENHQVGFFGYPIVVPILSCRQQLDEVFRDRRIISLQFRDPDPRLGDCPGGHFSEEPEMVWIVLMKHGQRARAP